MKLPVVLNLWKVLLVLSAVSSVGQSRSSPGTAGRDVQLSPAAEGDRGCVPGCRGCHPSFCTSPPAAPFPAETRETRAVRCPDAAQICKQLTHPSQLGCKERVSELAVRWDHL